MPADRRIVFYRSFLSDAGLVIALLITTALYVYSTIYYPWTVQEVQIFGHTLRLPLLGIFPIMALIVLVVRHYNYRYIIAEDHISVLSGILSFKMLDKRLDMQHIRGVEIERGILDRVFNVGDIEIGSVMHGQDDLVMYGVHRPDMYRRIIESRIADGRAPVQTENTRE